MPISKYESMLRENNSHVKCTRSYTHCNMNNSSNPTYVITRLNNATYAQSYTWIVLNERL